MDKLTHVTPQGHMQMVDISHKAETVRTATAQAEVWMQAELLQSLSAMPKGDALACARVAGIMAAKNTAGLIPLCHPIALTHVTIDFEHQPEQGCLLIRALCQVKGATGVEMEALTAVSIAALTIHDMVKAVDPAVEINHIHLIEKTGGKSGHWRRQDD